MRRLGIAALLLLTSGLVFLAWMKPHVLDPRRVGWLLDGQDRGQAWLGFYAYQQGGWPGMRQHLLLAPEGAPLLLTDSLPLVSWLLAPILPLGWQWAGWWLLLCVVLQLSFAWALLDRASGLVPRLIGTVLLGALPMFFARAPHLSLCAQWLILWALLVYRDPYTAERLSAWLPILGLAALIHSYLLLIVASIWAGVLLRGVVTGPRLATLARGVLGIAWVVPLLWVQGVFGAGFESSRTYGAFPLALDAWINPANPDLTALLPSSPNIMENWFEGFNYLGAGGLAVLALGLGAWLWRTGQAGGLDPELQRLGWLIPGFLVLTVVAIGPHPWWRGEPVFAWRLPPMLRDALDPVRASGRLFWPVTYSVMYVALIGVMQLRAATLALGAALALQIVDTAPMLAQLRYTSLRASFPARYYRARDPRWDALIARARQVDLWPADEGRGLPVQQDISARAVALGKPLGFNYVARVPVGARQRLAREAAAFAAGRVPAGHLVVLIDGKAPRPLRRRVRYLDGIAYIPARP